MSEKIIDLENTDLVLLFGANNRKLYKIKEFFPDLKLVARGNILKVIGNKSHILLLTRSDEKGNEVIIPAKLFEYLAIRRPILALIPEGEASKIIYQTKSGVVIPPNNISRIKAAVLDFYNKYEAGTLDLKQNCSLNQYERRFLTKKLSLILNKLSN